MNGRTGAGAACDEVDHDGASALVAACRLNQRDVAAALLGAGAVATLRDKHGRTALHYATELEVSGDVRHHHVITTSLTPTTRPS